MKDATDDELFTPAEAVFYLAQQHAVRTTVETIRRRCDAKSIECVRTASGRRLIPRRELERLATTANGEAA